MHWNSPGKTINASQPAQVYFQSLLRVFQDMNGDFFRLMLQRLEAAGHQREKEEKEESEGEVGIHRKTLPSPSTMDEACDLFVEAGRQRLVAAATTGRRL